MTKNFICLIAVVIACAIAGSSAGDFRKVARQIEDSVRNRTFQHLSDEFSRHQYIHKELHDRAFALRQKAADAVAQRLDEHHVSRQRREQRVIEHLRDIHSRIQRKVRRELGRVEGVLDDLREHGRTHFARAINREHRSRQHFGDSSDEILARRAEKVQEVHERIADFRTNLRERIQQAAEREHEQQKRRREQEHDRDQQHRERLREQRQRRVEQARDAAQRRAEEARQREEEAREKAEQAAEDAREAADRAKEDVVRSHFKRRAQRAQDVSEAFKAFVLPRIEKHREVAREARRRLRDRLVERIERHKNHSAERRSHRHRHFSIRSEHALGSSLLCDVAGATTRAAQSVHELRPHHIKVVAALGDSLTTANGAGNGHLRETFIEHRGRSFSIGGDQELARLTTIPNILRHFNNDIIGASTGVVVVGDDDEAEPNSLNLARPGATSRDLLAQAKELVSRLKAHKDIVYEEHWKLITIFIGANDICQSCQDSSLSPEEWSQNLVDAIAHLAENVPRAYVNLVNVVNVARLSELHNDEYCAATHKILCPCITEGRADAAFALAELYRNLTREVGHCGEFDTDDFAVTLQPFLEDFEIPFVASNVTGEASPDLSYLAPDCFHFSERTHVAAARALWNNMLSKAEDKLAVFEADAQSDELNCPVESCPYLRTDINSEDCSLSEDIIGADEETVDAATTIAPGDDYDFNSTDLFAPLLDQPLMTPGEAAALYQESYYADAGGNTIAVVLGVVSAMIIVVCATVLYVYRRRPTTHSSFEPKAAPFTQQHGYGTPEPSQFHDETATPTVWAKMKGALGSQKAERAPILSNEPTA